MSCVSLKNAQSKGRITRIWKNFGYASASQCSIDDIPTKQTSLSDRLITLFFYIFDLMYNSAYSYPPEQCVLLPYIISRTKQPRNVVQNFANRILHCTVFPQITSQVSHNNHGNVPYFNCQVSKLLYHIIIIS